MGSLYKSIVIMYRCMYILYTIYYYVKLRKQIVTKYKYFEDYVIL